ncbi:MAG: protease HtpX [Candidatus Lightella neohaematopini]|nr:protease HtpX [Candidatus Lightella neohaematopini]MCV2528957.1 protease HtpX [Candidatus Lightella neohaematopini]
MFRIIIFLITNIAVLIVFSLVLCILGININTIYHLLFLAIVFGFSGSLISLYMSKYIALRLVNGEIIKTPRNNIECWLLEIINNQSKILGINNPELVIYSSNDLNAFTTGARRQSSLLAISTELIKKMDKNEIQAVIAHEMSHIVNGDMITMTLIQGVTNTFVIFLSRIFAQLFSGINSDDNDRNNNQIIYFITSLILELVFGILANIVVLWFSRKREFYADAGAAKLVGVDNMIIALNKLKMNYNKFNIDNSISSFCINGKYSYNFSELFMSHPTLERRIQALINKTYLS